ncbi:MAG TPA: cytochrome c3 family protein [Blastocatellia bacterium]|nr:cytochrome c3 family protein [Blastocatellia bacterium]
MKVKLAVLILFVVAMPAALPARPFAIAPASLLEETFSQADCDRIKSNDDTARVIKLDLKGTRGVVLFRHRHHETYLNPDSHFAHQGQQGAECIGCHHKRTEFSGVPVLVKCIACHGVDGDPKNPRNKDGDEERSQRAFHDLCIGCHRASNAKGLVKCDKAPVACGECHAAKS